MTTQEIRDKKNIFRQEYRSIRSGIKTDEKTKLDHVITDLLLQSMSYKFAKNILVYHSYSDEVCTHIFAEKALKDGKKLFFPKSYKSGIMEFFAVNSLAELKKGMLGIFEPPEQNEKYVCKINSNNDLCIVPGLCFDMNGYRIGYGKGYYDRFLIKFKGVSVGIAYSKCVYNLALPIEKRYDRHVDLLLTEKGIEIFAFK